MLSTNILECAILRIWEGDLHHHPQQRWWSSSGCKPSYELFLFGLRIGVTILSSLRKKYMPQTGPESKLKLLEQWKLEFFCQHPKIQAFTLTFVPPQETTIVWRIVSAQSVFKSSKREKRNPSKINFCSKFNLSVPAQLENEVKQQLKTC